MSWNGTGLTQDIIGKLSGTCSIRRHLKVPGDVKFVAYDGTFITELVEPKMTAVVQPIESLAKESVRILCDLIGGKDYKNKQVMLEAQLRKGNTTIV